MRLPGQSQHRLLLMQLCNQRVTAPPSTPQTLPVHLCSPSRLRLWDDGDSAWHPGEGNNPEDPPLLPESHPALWDRFSSTHPALHWRSSAPNSMTSSSTNTLSPWKRGRKTGRSDWQCMVRHLALLGWWERPEPSGEGRPHPHFQSLQQDWDWTSTSPPPADGRRAG